VRLHFDTGTFSAGQMLAGRSGSHVGWGGVAAAALALAALLAGAWQLAQARQDLASTAGELQALGRRQPVATPPPQRTLSPEQRRAWNHVVGQLNTPWAALLAGLEAATPEDVALVSVEPDPPKSSVRLQAEAKTLDALLTYSQRLASVEPFGDVTLLKHDTNEQDPNRPVRLTLSVGLRRPVRLSTVAGEAR
jgi:Tfp pilus assembly protein PilN